MRLILRLFLSAAALYFSAWLIPDIQLNGYTTALIAAVVLALLNTFIRPILSFFAFPVTFLTLGLFSLVINTAIIMICSYFVNDFNVHGFYNAFIFSIVYSVINWIIQIVFGLKD